MSNNEFLKLVNLLMSDKESKEPSIDFKPELNFDEFIERSNGRSLYEELRQINNGYKST